MCYMAFVFLMEHIKNTNAQICLGVAFPENDIFILSTLISNKPKTILMNAIQPVNCQNKYYVLIDLTSAIE